MLPGCNRSSQHNMVQRQLLKRQFKVPAALGSQLSMEDTGAIFNTGKLIWAYDGSKGNCVVCRV